MAVLLAACRVSEVHNFLSWGLGGTTLTWAPVSMRKRREEDRSVTKSKWLGLRPVTWAASTYWPCCFPEMNMAVCTCELFCQNVHGTNICLWMQSMVVRIALGASEEMESADADEMC